MKKEKNDPASLFKDYKILLQQAEKNILKKQDVIATLTSTIVCLQKSKQKLMAGNKTLTMLNAELRRKSKQASALTAPPRQCKVVKFLLRSLLGPILEVDTNTPSWVEREVSML